MSGAESWDAPGLLAGDPAAPVESIVLAVDAVLDTVDEALASDLLIVHHPLLLRGVTSVAEDRYKGAVLSRLIRANTALLAAHTNADVVETGTSAVFADRLGLRNATPIVAAALILRFSRARSTANRFSRPTTSSWNRTPNEVTPTVA